MLYRVLDNQIWVLNNKVKVVQRKIVLVEARRTRQGKGQGFVLARRKLTFWFDILFSYTHPLRIVMGQ